MKKIIIFTSILFILAVVFTSLLYSIDVTTPAAEPYYVGANLGFRPTNSAFGQVYDVNWDFGDQNTTTAYGAQTVYHSYSAVGQYTVTVTAVSSAVTPPPPETLDIWIANRNRYIQVSPATPTAGLPATFTANRFTTPDNIRWDMGDGTILSSSGRSKARIKGIKSRRGMRGHITATNVVTHTYTAPGNYTVRAYDFNGTATIPVTLNITVQQPNRQIIYQPQSPRADQSVQFQVVGFLTSSIDWNFGDGTIMIGSSTFITHRFQGSGTFTVSAKDSDINHTPVTTTINVLSENRYITASPPEVRTNEPVIVRAFNFRGDFILWDFGDGTRRTGLHTGTHDYTRAGVYTITAWDENGESQVPFTTQVTVRGINDEVNLEVAEIRFDNGKYYKVVSKNSKYIRAVLRMKMRGTGIVSGYWEVDGHPFEFFNEVVSQGQLKEIYTREVPGIPTIDSGIHTLTIRLTRPTDLDVQFPVLKYFVLPYENIVKTLTPVDGFIAKDDEIPEFSWEATRGANKYQITFSNYLYPIMSNAPGLKWIDVETTLKYTPGKHTWNNIKRNRWTYWKVRALDTFGNVTAESDIQDIKVVIATAKISINKVTDLEGKKIRFDKSKGNLKTRTDDADILVHGSIEYMGDSKYLVLRVYANKKLSDQLLFRDVKKGEKRFFETSIPNTGKETRILFQVLNTSSPAVIVGIKNLLLKKAPGGRL